MYWLVGCTRYSMHDTLTVHPPHTHHTLTTHSLQTHYTLATHPLYLLWYMIYPLDLGMPPSPPTSVWIPSTILAPLQWTVREAMRISRACCPVKVFMVYGVWCIVYSVCHTRHISHAISHTPYISHAMLRTRRYSHTQASTYCPISWANPLPRPGQKLSTTT
jgi:hypothetical protein